MSVARLARLAWRGAQPVTGGSALRPSFDPLVALDATQPLPLEATATERRAAMPLAALRASPQGERPAVGPAHPAAEASPYTIAVGGLPGPDAPPVATVAAPALPIATAASTVTTRDVAIMTPAGGHSTQPGIPLPAPGIDTILAPAATPITAAHHEAMPVAPAYRADPRVAEAVPVAAAPAPAWAVPAPPLSAAPPAAPEAPAPEIHIDRVEVIMAPSAPRPARPVTAPQATAPDRGFARYAAMRSGRDRGGW